MPGSPLDPRSEGTNGLIKQGAVLVTEAEDVLAALGPIAGRPSHGPIEEPAPPDHADPPPTLAPASWACSGRHRFRSTTLSGSRDAPPRRFTRPCWNWNLPAASNVSAAASSQYYDFGEGLAG